MTASTNNRDLDCAVAEALGAELERFGNGNVEIVVGPGDGSMPPGKYRTTIQLPHYSTNITAAIEALEEFCRVRGYGWAVDRKPPGGSVIAFIFKFDDPTNAWCGEGEIATAICRAIVAAAQEKPTSA